MSTTTETSNLPLIPEKRLSAVCKIGQGEATCRFIVGDSRGLCCAKHEVWLSMDINARVMFNQMKAKGDNCEGIVK